MTTRMGRVFAGAVLGTLLAAGTAFASATIDGYVVSISPSQIAIAAGAYDITKETSIEDLGGNHPALHEIRAGTPVSLDFDDEGHLVTIRATLAR